ncbi:MAG: gephyrin-like molybdotransferase Glp [Bacillota bacterium]
MFDVKSVDEVIKIIKESFSDIVLKTEVVDIKEAVGRVTVEDVISGEEIPVFNRSSVDGYAVISSDTFGASDSTPAQLRLVGEVKMGEKPEMNLQRGKAVYVPTGGQLPKNADAVVMIEYAENYDDGFIYINKAAAPGSSVVFKGDDIKEGSIVIRQNHVLRPQDIGMLAALGFQNIKVKNKVRIGIISTGDEVVGIDAVPKGAKVRDINSYALYSAVLNDGGIPKLYGIVEDNFDKIKEMVEKALLESDIVLISGGSSVGTRDETFKVINSLGLPGILVHGIAVKPGKPTILGKIYDKAVFGLPGHPASAFVIYKIFVSYLMDIINGIGPKLKKTVRAKLSCNYPSNNGREEFIPVKLEEADGKTLAVPVFGKSGLISILTSADGYVHKRRGYEGIPSGQEIEVILF